MKISALEDMGRGGKSKIKYKNLQKLVWGENMEQTLAISGLTFLYLEFQ